MLGLLFIKWFIKDNILQKNTAGGSVVEGQCIVRMFFSFILNINQNVLENDIENKLLA